MQCWFKFMFYHKNVKNAGSSVIHVGEYNNFAMLGIARRALPMPQCFGIAMELQHSIRIRSLIADNSES